MQVFSIDKTNPPIDEKLDFFSTVQVPEDVNTMLKYSCVDCHSHSSKYPWYTNIEPISWWIKGHIKGGLQHLNFSVWQAYDAPKRRHKIDECIEVLEQERMPIKSYTWAHKEAKLTDEDRKRLIVFFESLRDM